jgi:hypothetical protein
MHFAHRNLAGAEILDFAIFSNVLSHHSVHTLGSPSTSHHSPQETNWKLFQNHIVHNRSTQWLQGNCSKNETDVAIMQLTDTLNRATHYATPNFEISANRQLHTYSHSKKEQAVEKNPQHYSSLSH